MNFLQNIIIMKQLQNWINKGFLLMSLLLSVLCCKGQIVEGLSVTFDDFTSETFYYATDYDLGDLLFTENDVAVTLQGAIDADGNWLTTSGFAHVSLADWGGLDTPPLLSLTDASVWFDFQNVGVEVLSATFDMVHGEWNNISVNDQPITVFTDINLVAPTPTEIAPGVILTVFPTAAPDVYRVQLVGTIQNLLIGGEEIAIDNMYCEVGVEETCITFDTAPNDGFFSPAYAVGDSLFAQNGVVFSLASAFGGGPGTPPSGVFVPAPWIGPAPEAPHLVCMSASVELDFAYLDGNVTELSFDYYLGISPSISVNGEPVISEASITDFPTAIAPGVTLSITPIPGPDGDDYTVTLIGNIETVVVGGVNVIADNFCFELGPIVEPSLCYDLEDFTLGEVFQGYDHFPGDVIWTQDGIDLSLEEIDLGGSTPFFGVAEVIDVSGFSGSPIGAGNLLYGNHIGLQFDFSNMTELVTGLSFEMSVGGAIWLTINGDEQYEDGIFDVLEFDFGPDIQVTVIETGFGAGIFTITGNIETIGFEGQFYVLDNLCLETLPDVAPIVEVWPGDTDDDGIANNFDLLPIGIAYNSTGNARAGASLNWEAQIADPWGATLADGTDYAHTDCNGNGTTDFDDIDAIIVNYNLTHGKNEGEEASEETEPPFYVELPTTSIVEGDWIAAPVMLGDVDLPVTDLYGIAFTIEYDADVMDASSIFMTFEESWLGEEGVNMITLSKNFASNGTIDVALVRTDQMNQSGAGKIGTFNGIIDNIAGKDESELEFTLTLSNVRAISLDEAEILLNITFETIILTDLFTPDNPDFAKIYPNPAKHQIRIDVPSQSNLQAIRFYNVMGQKVLDQKTIDTSLLIDVQSLKAGVYFVQLQFENETVSRKVEIIR